MAEAGVRQGHALRVYQILFVLALGWLAGRLPGLLAENDVEQLKLSQAMGVEQPYARPPASEVDTARLAADVASRVAAEVADQTISRLIAAGWAPPGAPLPVAFPSAPRETVVRVVSETAPAQSYAWSLPPVAATPEAPVAVAPAAQPQNPPGNEPAERAHKLATSGYAALQAGDRKQAVALLNAAMRMAPEAPAAAQWQADVRQMTRRWSFGGYVLSRGGGGSDPLAASPVLGGGQAGAAVGYTFNPLSKTRVSLVGRVTAAAGPNGGLDSETTEAALGLRLQPFRSVPVAVDVERRFALGTYSRNAWAARISGGDAKELKVAGKRLRLEGYGEAGVIGFEAEPALYAGGQARGGTPIATFGNVAVNAGAGLWGGAQRDYGVTASRFDLGPSAQFQVKPWPFRAQVDYRFRAAGNALPGSGPVITVAGEF
jgi:hypothetical protein